VLRLDTPGGLDTSMRLIIKDITASPIPVIVYVAPSGGRAASAGVFILYSAHIAAMSPGTNVGAAHPVAMGGGEMDAVMKAKVEESPMGWRLEALKALSDPNIAFILMTLGTIGLLAELYNPGAILPGIVGAISLILAFYSLQTLPINYAGVLLLLLGIVLFILEIKVMSYGLLSLGGIASMVLGALLLVKTDAPFLKESMSVIIPTVLPS